MHRNEDEIFMQEICNKLYFALSPINNRIIDADGLIRSIQPAQFVTRPITYVLVRLLLSHGLTD
jgi:hypothetical protein